MNKAEAEPPTSRLIKTPFHPSESGINSTAGMSAISGRFDSFWTHFTGLARDGSHPTDGRLIHRLSISSGWQSVSGSGPDVQIQPPLMVTSFQVNQRRFYATEEEEVEEEVEAEEAVAKTVETEILLHGKTSEDKRRQEEMSR